MSDTQRELVMACEAARPMLRARPDTEAAQSSLAAHLSECASCAEFRESQVALDREISATLVMEPPAWLTAAIIERVSSEPAVAWWARPRLSLALQWSFYFLLTGGLVLGLLLTPDQVSSAVQAILALPSQLSVVLEVLMVVVGLVPLDPIIGLLDDSLVYELAALILVFLWLRPGGWAPAARPRP